MKRRRSLLEPWRKPITRWSAVFGACTLATWVSVASPQPLGPGGGGPPGARPDVAGALVPLGVGAVLNALGVPGPAAPAPAPPPQPVAPPAPSPPPPQGPGFYPGGPGPGYFGPPH
jgi:hypothetical protein